MGCLFMAIYTKTGEFKMKSCTTKEIIERFNQLETIFGKGEPIPPMTLSERIIFRDKVWFDAEELKKEIEKIFRVEENGLGIFYDINCEYPNPYIRLNNLKKQFSNLLCNSSEQKNK